MKDGHWELILSWVSRLTSGTDFVMVPKLSLGTDLVVVFFLFQAYSICVSSFSEISPQTAEASALLAKAYAMSGESQHKGR